MWGRRDAALPINSFFLFLIFFFQKRNQAINNVLRILFNKIESSHYPFTANCASYLSLFFSIATEYDSVLSDFISADSYGFVLIHL